MPQKHLLSRPLLGSITKIFAFAKSPPPSFLISFDAEKQPKLLINITNFKTDVADHMLQFRLPNYCSQFYYTENNNKAYAVS